MKEGYWVIRTYEAGTVGEKTKFFIPGDRPTGKLSRRQRNAIRKQEQNEYSSQKALARLLNANFQGGDLLLGLDYNEQGMEKILAWGRTNGLPVDSDNELEQMDAIWEAAAHEMELCLRRVKGRLKKQEMELMAVYITSDMDGDTGERVRVHHHLVVKKEAKEAFLDAWKDLGGVDWSPLWDYKTDRTAIAEYFMRQVRRIPDAKKYRSTRNLVRPKPKDRIALTDSELRVPKGAELLFRQAYKPGWPQYIRYTLPRKKVPEEPPENFCA